jgi:hypothetical protein
MNQSASFPNIGLDLIFYFHHIQHLRATAVSHDESLLEPAWTKCQGEDYWPVSSLLKSYTRNMGILFV